ncbi:MAG TPA: hypothetical protein VEP50_16365 [bacterium]|nr:hypothetical protein [bacterium]
MRRVACAVVGALAPASGIFKATVAGAFLRATDITSAEDPWEAIQTLHA